MQTTQTKLALSAVLAQPVTIDEIAVHTREGSAARLTKLTIQKDKLILQGPIAKNGTATDTLIVIKMNLIVAIWAEKSAHGYPVF